MDQNAKFLRHHFVNAASDIAVTSLDDGRHPDMTGAPTRIILPQWSFATTGNRFHEPALSLDRR
jgi:hypothetical protein